MVRASPPPSPLPFLLYENETYEYCIVLPPKVNSAGIWENEASPLVIFNYSLPLLEMQVVLTFVITHAGITISPMMNLQSFRSIFFNKESSIEVIDTVSMFGFALFLFLTGVKMDMKLALRTTKRSVGIGVVSLLSSILVGAAINETFKQPNQTEQVKTERLIGTVIEALTSFSVIACLLAELKILNTELGRLALTSAAVGDLSTMFLVHVMSLSRNFTASPLLVIERVVIMFCFITLIIFVFRPLMYWVIKRTPDGGPVAEVYITATMMVALGCAVFTHWTDRSPLIGAFLFGLAVPDGPPLGSALIDKFECFINAFFLSIYVIASTLRANFGNMDSLAFGLVMSSKGIVQLSHYSTFRDNQVLSETGFTAMVIAILVNATIIPILVRFLYDPDSRKYAAYEQRNIMHLKPDAELRILACVHTSDNVPAMINLLDLTYPTRESPNVVYVLHLIELMARNSPVFIAHHNHESSTATTKSFEKIIPFYRYEGNNWGLVTVNAFTVITPRKLMHEDICMMALDKQTSFIILPFHRKWSIDGSLEEENNVVRNLNCTVLDQAPCSVGILIDRGRRQKPMKPSSPSSCSIGMLFLGGKDDREALMLAKRMARGPRVKLTVTRLIEYQDCSDVVDWDTVLDTEMLKDVKQNNGVLGNGYDITYVEEVLHCGSQTIKLVRSIANDYDLMIVGRHYGVESVLLAGLSEWSEFPELGILGDLFASMDLNSRVSILVVQQQIV
ncbi:cation/H(+) antiporter 4 [Gossypium raimondii]|uniref:cation/H(+) antiporter 4 n=1 Tax=Gossypium raimondii TaxID=29730 RepID=UPI00227C33BA|nr:cation/H(+) antiporter 4 [Gossypium raimondii]